MSGVIYIGDEVSAAGYRLAGAQTLVPGPGEEAEALASIAGRDALVLVSAAIVGRVAQQRVHDALARLAPLVAIVPDLAGAAAPLDLAQRLRRQLGLDA